MNRIEWIIIITSNYQDSKVFYRDIIGFTLEREVPEDEFCQFKLENCIFALFGRRHLEKVLDKKYLGTPGAAIYSFPQSQNIDQQYRDLKEKGVTFIKDPTTQPWGQRTAYFTDPDGHIWEIQQWLKKD